MDTLARALSIIFVRLVSDTGDDVVVVYRTDTVEEDGTAEVIEFVTVDVAAVVVEVVVAVVVEAVVVAIAEVTGQKLRKKVSSKYFPVARKVYCLRAAASYVGMVVKFAMPKCLLTAFLCLQGALETPLGQVQ